MSANSLERLQVRAAECLAGQLREQVARLTWGADRLVAHQRDRLRVLLGHAIERSPFHAQRLRGVDPGGFELADLRGLPVMTKAQMTERFDEVVTDRRLTRERVEQHLTSSAEEVSLLFDDYVCLASGGSSGLRGVFVQTLGEYSGFLASLLRHAISRTTQLGEPRGGDHVVAVVAAASPTHSTGFATAIFAGGPITKVAVPATLAVGDIVDRLNKIRPSMLTGYPSKLAQIAREQMAGRLRIAPSSITACSETLTPEDRAVITAAFGVPVIDQFASTEGLVGQSEPGGSILTFASDMCIAELVAPDTTPVRPGQPCAKVLVTNLNNLTQPLIRYELTDSFVEHPDSAHHGFLRAAVAGRTDDVFRYGNIEIHPLVIRTLMVKTAAVREYQVRQTTHGIDVAIVAEAQFDRTALIGQLKLNLSKAGLTAPDVTVRMIDAIDQHRETGKTRRFIPHEPS